MSKLNILDLSDEVLLQVLKRINDLKDLVSMYNTCIKLRRLCQDPTIKLKTIKHRNWQSDQEIVKKFLDKKSERLILSDFNFAVEVSKQPSKTLLNYIAKSMVKLTELTLSSCLVYRIKLDHFPKNLKTLRLIECKFVSFEEYRQFSKQDLILRHTTPPYPHNLIIKNCAWTLLPESRSLSFKTIYDFIQSDHVPAKIKFKMEKVFSDEQKKVYLKAYGLNGIINGKGNEVKEWKITFVYPISN